MIAFGRPLRPLWALEDDMVFLNHGSYGATPRELLAVQDRWRMRLEAQPVRFFNQELPGALRTAAVAAARFLGTAPERLAFLENASSGTNAVLRSIPWRPGDRIVATDHVYNAVRKNLAHLAATHGVVPVEVPLALPVTSAEAIVAAVTHALEPAPRLLLLDHIASATAVVMPVAELVAAARARGVPVLIDGAHGPGQIDLDVDVIGADVYVGNAHKWLCAPKGAAFIAVKPNLPFELHPTVISHDYGGGFAAEFDKIGTRDPSAWLTVPDAIALHERLGGSKLRARSIALAREAGHRMAAALGTTTAAPDALTAAMACVKLPIGGATDWPAARALRLNLWERHRVEMHVTSHSGALWARVSIAPYTDMADVEAAIVALREVLRA